MGDTATDIEEGKNAGAISVGIIEGSSIMGLAKDEYESLTKEQKEKEILRVKKVYGRSGADYILLNMSELCDLILCIDSRQEILL